MFWRFASVSHSLDNLLDRGPDGFTLEELLDEDDLLSELKIQNSRLVDYLTREKTLKRLLEMVVGETGWREREGEEREKRIYKYPYYAAEILTSDLWAIVEAIFSSPSMTQHLLGPFWDAVLPLCHLPPLSETSSGSSDTEQTEGEGEVIEPSALGLEPGPAGLSSGSDSEGEGLRENPNAATTIGLWTRVNSSFLDRKGNDMMNFIRSRPRIVERLVAHLEAPAVADMLYRIVQCEEQPSISGVVDWLTRERLIPRTIALLSPSYSPDLHNAVSDLLRAIIAFSAPSPSSLSSGPGSANSGGVSNPFGGSDGGNTAGVEAAAAFGSADPSGGPGAFMDGGGGSGGGPAGGENEPPLGLGRAYLNNRLARELVSEESVKSLVRWMLESHDGCDAEADVRDSLDATNLEPKTGEENNTEDGGTGGTDGRSLRMGASVGVGGLSSEVPPPTPRTPTLSLSSRDDGARQGAPSVEDKPGVVDEEEGETMPLPLNPRDSPASEGMPLPSLFAQVSGSTPPSGAPSRTASPSHSFGLSSFPSPSGTIPPPPQLPITSPPTPASRLSSLTTAIGVLVELIRKNNADFFEQYLFHTLRGRLVEVQRERREEKEREKEQRKQEELAKAREEAAGRWDRREDSFASDASDATVKDSCASLASSSPPTSAIEIEAGSSEEEVGRREDTGAVEEAENAEKEEQEELDAMEKAMEDVTRRLGIVNLTFVLQILGAEMGDLQARIKEPRSGRSPQSTPLGMVTPLTTERYRIAELYAELLHCSNMGPFNRPFDVGPEYAPDGTLLGGLDGLQKLGRLLQGSAGNDEPNFQEAPKTGDLVSSAEPESAVTTSGDFTLPDGARSTSPPSESTVEAEEAPRLRHGRHAREASSISAGSMEEDEGLDVAAADDLAGQQAAPLSEASAVEPKDEHLFPESAEGPFGEGTKTLHAIDSTGAPIPSIPGHVLKKSFLREEVIEGIIDLFFSFPWNNFLHNVVYDVLQQVFHAPMEDVASSSPPQSSAVTSSDSVAATPNLNKALVGAVFRSGRLISRILEADRRSAESEAQPKPVRLGFMGHVYLIADEIVKLFEHYPQLYVQLTSEGAVDEAAWTALVEGSLRESREKDSHPLGGGRPATNVGNNSLDVEVDADDDDDDDDFGARKLRLGLALSEEAPGFSSAFSPATAAAGLNSDVVGGGQFARYLSQQISSDLPDKFGSSDEDDDEDDAAGWMTDNRIFGTTRRSYRGDGSSSFDDEFSPSQDDDFGDFESGMGTSDASREDDAFGPFSSSDAFGFPSAPSTSTGSASVKDPFAPPTSSFSTRGKLTTADWNADFQQGASFDDSFDDSFGDSAFGPDDDGARTPTASTSPVSPSWQGLSSPSAPHFDLSDPSSIRQQRDGQGGSALTGSPPRTRSRSSSSGSAGGQDTVAIGGSSTPRRRASLSGSSDLISAAAASPEAPLGPGVSPETEVTPSGLKKKLEDGSEVTAPLDEIAIAAEQSGLVAAPQGHLEADDADVQMFPV